MMTLPCASRRMAAVPKPFTDESFGSWFARLAAEHFASRLELARALLSEAGESDLDLQQFDSSRPSEALLKILAQRTPLTGTDLQALLVPEVLARRLSEPESYCPLCWKQDLPQGTRHIRRQWSEKYALLCEEHEVPLRPSRWPAERLLSATCTGSSPWIGTIRACMWPSTVCRAMIRTQRTIRALALNMPLSADDAARTRVTLELARLVGTDFEGQSLIEESFDLEPGVDHRLAWQNEDDEGSLEVRQLAVRLSLVILSRMTDTAASLRAEDLSVVAALNSLPPHSSIARACENMLVHWRADYRALWELTFGAPGRGGAGHFARHYGRTRSREPQELR